MVCYDDLFSGFFHFTEDGKHLRFEFRFGNNHDSNMTRAMTRVNNVSFGAEGIGMSGGGKQVLEEWRLNLRTTDEHGWTLIFV